MISHKRKVAEQGPQRHMKHSGSHADIFTHGPLFAHNILYIKIKNREINPVLSLLPSYRMYLTPSVQAELHKTNSGDTTVGPFTLYSKPHMDVYRRLCNSL